ncbi:phage tail length tape measure family protein [Alterisphingorhabdus coralli]|uniref:Phage tail length tape measure family protein n=1 Tax=Alterisphingorhabdus coralli TaxID=3071408 RepID=A0AA97I2J7_9SPHN|nr:phage tail length tape measure family protein [Parasphingorhabdus sp. SCSIO 66989]WOE76323.1 phage tail length tape measure family protein [Parasphingorhabdus sp. SCSIO 66989]
MARRDVTLAIKARNEADRAIDSISSSLRALAGIQDQVGDTGERTGDTLGRLGQLFATLDSAYSRLDQSVNATQASMSSQEATLAENEARYSALRREIEAAEQAIVTTRIAIQNDGSEQLVGRLAGAQQAYRRLVGEAGRLEAKIEGQRSDLAATGVEYDGLKNAATAAQIAMGDMGNAGEREAMRVAAASRDAAAALRDQAQAAREEVNARNAQSAINAQLGVRDFDSGAARSSAAVFEEDARAKREAADATRELETAAAALRQRARPLAVEQERINQEMTQARDLYKAGKINIRDLTAELDRLEHELKQVDTAQKSVNRNGSAEIRGVLGLRPYEMQNLAYQINDVFTQIASGTPVSQTFAQQGGQIIQIFPKLLTGFLRYARVLGLAGVALAPVVIAMGRLNEQAQMQRQFAASLALTGQNARQSADDLMEHVAAVEALGESSEDAASVVETFMQNSINPEMMDAMAAAAQNVAEIRRQDLTEAAEDVAKAFSGGYKEIAKYDDELNFLTLSEREQIRAMFESGQESDARDLAFQRFFRNSQQRAAELETSWDRMVDAMSGAWLDFKNWLADLDVFGTLREELDSAWVGATYLINRIRGMSHEAAGNAAVGNTQASQTPSGDTLDTDDPRVLKRESDKRREEELAEQRRRGRRRRRRGGKSLAQMQAEFNREIARENEEREIQAGFVERTNVLAGENLILEQRRQAIATAIRKAEERASRDSKKRLTLSAQQREEIARTVGLEFDANNRRAIANARREEHERRVNELLGQRQSLAQSLEFTSPDTSEFDAIQTRLFRVTSTLAQARQDSIAEWEKVLGDPQQLALLEMTAAEVKNIIGDLRNASNAERREMLDAMVQANDQTVNDLTAMRDLLQEQIFFAQVQGQPGRVGELETQLAQVNERLIDASVNAIEMWRSLRGSPEDLATMGLTAAEVDNIILGLENTIAATKELRTQFLRAGQALNQELSQGGANAMEEFARSIVDGENALLSFGRAFLQFASDFLLNIARMIAQQAIFNALSNGSPGGVGSGGVGGAISTAIGSLFHGGGVVSNGGRSRRVAASVFANAARYHNGGIAGLQPDEVPAILKRGEETITRDDPRHRFNQGEGGKQVSQILAIGEEQIAQAMNSAAGREMLLTFIRTERATVRQELNI